MVWAAARRHRQVGQFCSQAIDGRYPFHFVADSVRLVESASGGCDAAFMYTSRDVEEFFSSVGSAEAAQQLCNWLTRAHQRAGAPGGSV